jgi:GT2 family glycosyltransferase
MTDRCLETLTKAMQADPAAAYDVYLVDDASTDGTAALVRDKYPEVHLIHGTGSLFWAGGMRLAWQTALKEDKTYDGFLLINDDVEFEDSFWKDMTFTHQYCLRQYGQEGLYVSSLRDKETGQHTYGGHILKKRIFKHQTLPVLPAADRPVPCQLSNANILYVPAKVIKRIGTLDERFTHSLADFDYTLSAGEQNIPLLLCPNYGGFCSGGDRDQLPQLPTLRSRMQHLYGVKGIALNEYLYYLRKHFPWKAPYAFAALWAEALFPFTKRKNSR